MELGDSRAGKEELRRDSSCEQTKTRTKNTLKTDCTAASPPLTNTSAHSTPDSNKTDKKNERRNIAIRVQLCVKRWYNFFSTVQVKTVAVKFWNNQTTKWLCLHNYACWFQQTEYGTSNKWSELAMRCDVRWGCDACIVVHQPIRPTWKETRKHKRKKLTKYSQVWDTIYKNID